MLRRSPTPPLALSSPPPPPRPTLSPPQNNVKSSLFYDSGSPLPSSAPSYGPLKSSKPYVFISIIVLDFIPTI